MIFRTGILCALMLLLGACAEVEVPDTPGPMNNTTGVQVSSNRNFIILRRGTDVQKICSRYERDRFHFFSAAKAPIVYAEAVNPDGDNALLRMDLPGKDFPLNETKLRQLTLSAKMKGKNVRITKILTARADGLVLGVEYRTPEGKTEKAEYQVESGELSPISRKQDARK